VLLDVKTRSLERLDDLLNMRQAIASFKRGTRDPGIDVLAEGLLGGARRDARRCAMRVLARDEPLDVVKALDDFGGRHAA
jgi:hypothetical protein